MKLPHITIEYQEEESYAEGKVSLPLILGFSAHWAWVYLFMFNGGQLLYPGTAYMQDALFLVAIATLAVTIMCYGVFLNEFRELFGTAKRRSRNRFVAACMVFFGMVLMLVSPFMPSLVWACVVVSGVLCGVGSAVLLMSYGISFSVCDLPTVAMNLAVVVPLGAIVFAVVFLFGGEVFRLAGVVCLAIPFIEYVCLHYASRQLVDNLEFGSFTIPVKTLPFALHVCLPNAVFGFLLGIISVRTISLSMEEGLGSAVGAIALAAIVAGLALVAAMLTQRHANNFAFRTLLPIVGAFAAALAVVPGANSGYVATFFLFGMYVMLSICIWVFCSDVSQRFRISGFTVFGFGWGTMTMGTMVGVALCMAGGPLESVPYDATQLMAVAIVALLLGQSLLPRNVELRHALKRGTTCPALVSSEDYALSRFDDFIFTDSRPFNEEGGEAGEYSVVSANEADGKAEASAVEKFDASIGGATKQAIADARAAELTAESGEVSEERHSSSMGRFKRKCSVVADRYMLSRKETEVLFLLAKGYKSAQIQETLFISEGTANTHMRHIYRKLDVHSQRELMGLIEAEQVPEEEF